MATDDSPQQPTYAARRAAAALAATCCLACATPAAAFFANARWTTTASGSAGPIGTHATLTWSIVPDGTTVAGAPGAPASSFIAFFDGQFPGGSGEDLTQRPWFLLVSSSFDRWTELSGLTLTYEPADDGAQHGSFPGSLGVRGDVRLAGAFLDGVGGTNAQAGFIPNGDIAIDAGDSPFFGAAAANYLNARNTIMHEIGHSLGLAHVNSDTSNFLMEPFSSAAYDGPQWDDIRGVQYLYGDMHEKAHPAGNDFFNTATALGAIAHGKAVKLGIHAATGTFVGESETDFLSIANAIDVDVFAFTVDEASQASVTVTPVGASYNERPGTAGAYTSTNSSISNDLMLGLYATTEDGPLLLMEVNANSVGLPESILDFALPCPGEYFVRISGDRPVVQFYTLQIATDQSATPGDFNDDGHVDGADFLAWQTGLGAPFDDADLADWHTNFGAAPNSALARFSIPEQLPTTSIALAAIAGSSLRIVRRAHAPRRA